MGVTVLVFAVELQKVRAPNAFSPIFKRGLGRVSKLNVCHRGKKLLNNPFFQNLHLDITFRTQSGKESASMKIKVSKHKLNIHYRGSP